MRTTRFLLLAATLACLAPDAEAQTRTAEAPAPRTSAPESRDDWQRAPDIFAALGAGPGSRVADLGAGEGWLTTRLARHVGPSGRVFASDISESALQRLSEVIAADTLLRHVELILAEADDPRLPYGTLDGVVIVNAYHEMRQRVAVLDGVKRALKPGGRLVIVDATPADSIHVRREQTSRHTLGIEFVRDDLEAQGFEIIATEPDFVSYEHPNHVHRQWLLVARLPER